MSCDMLRIITQHTRGRFTTGLRKTLNTTTANLEFRPVDLSLSKAQLIKELARRWEGFQPVRDLYQTKPVPTEDDDCPICLECTTTSYKWVYTVSSWEKVEDKVTTECKHSFCKKCWASHTEKNRRYDYSATW